MPSILSACYSPTAHLMSHALAVSAFPNPQQRCQAAPTRLVLDTSAKRLGGEPVPALNAAGSVEQSWKSAQLSDEALASPSSPMIFRTVDEPGRYLDHDVDRSLRHISPSRPLVASHRGAQAQQLPAAASTKAHIAALGLARSPSPSYDLLSTSAWLSPPRGHLDLHIPPRSSSLPSSRRISICGSSHTMSRSPTPSSVDSDRCSMMVFAEPSPQEAEYGSAPTLSVRTTPAAGPSHAPRTTSALSHHTPHDDGDFDPTPYSLMHAGPGFAAGFVPPRRPKPKPRAKPAAPTSAPAPAPAPPADGGSLRSGFRRMKRLATRRSVSSFDFLAAPADHAAPAARAHSPYAAEPGRSAESVASTAVSTPSDDDAERGVLAHKVVGDVWEPQELNAVIPALRSLKVSGKLGL